MGESQWRIVRAGWEYMFMHGWLLPLAKNVLPVGIHYFLQNLNGITHTYIHTYAHTQNIKAWSISHIVHFQKLRYVTLKAVNTVFTGESQQATFAPFLTAFIGSVSPWADKPNEARPRHLNQCEEVSRPMSDPCPFQSVSYSSIIPLFFRCHLPSLLLSISLLPPLPDSFLTPLTPKC